MHGLLLPGVVSARRCPGVLFDGAIDEKFAREMRERDAVDGMPGSRVAVRRRGGRRSQLHALSSKNAHKDDTGRFAFAQTLV